MTFKLPRLADIGPYLSGWPAPVGLILLVALHLAGKLPYQEWLRTASFDLYQVAAPRERVSEPVLIVDIDEQSLSEYGQWPWPRSLMAQLLDRLWEMKPAAVAFDIIMPEADRASPCQVTQYIPGIEKDLVDKVCRLPGNDTLLAGALKRGNSVLGVAGLDSEGTPPMLHVAPSRLLGENPHEHLRHFTTALTSIPELDDAARGHAILSVDPDHGVVRRIPLVASVGDHILPTLSLEMLRIAGQSPMFTVRANNKGVTAVGIPDLMIPTQQDGSLWIHYGPHDQTRFIPAAQVLNGKLPEGRLDHKLVLIGFSGLGLVDYPTTALGERVPGVEIHAQLLESIFDGTTLLRPAWALWAEGAIMLALGLLVILAFPRILARYRILVMIVAIALLIAAGLFAYLHYNLLIDVASPTFLFVLMFGAMLADSLIREEVQLKALEEDLRLQQEQAAKTQGEMEAAMRFQMGILPDVAASFDQESRIDIAAYMQPAKMVGGDLYDCFMLDEHRMFFSVGDVCGKGVPASLFMVISKTLWKSVALRDDMHFMNLGKLMRQANMEISRDNTEMLFVTAFVGLLDLRNGELTYCNAGHEKPLILAAGCHPRELEGAGGPPVSIMEDFEYKTHRYQLSPQEILCIFTDGATEAFSPEREEFGKPRLAEALDQVTPETTAQDIVQMTVDTIARFVDGGEPSDDLTVMALRWKGSPEAA
jgi:CHASE2 domain-containing sensor protein